MNDRAELVEVGEAINACNAVAVAEPIKASLVAALRPIAERLAEYEHEATLPVSNQSQADAAVAICNRIACDVKTVKGDEVLSRITDGLHKLHRRFTGLTGMFLNPLEEYRKTIKNKVIAWEQIEAQKAAKERARLQSIADEKARLEREKLERQAAILKTPEKKEERYAAAAAVVAPVISIAAPKTGLRTATVWKVISLDAAAFVAACAARPDLLGYIEISQSKLERAKAANGLFEVSGVVFDKITR